MKASGNWLFLWIKINSHDIMMLIFYRRKIMFNFEELRDDAKLSMKIWRDENYDYSKLKGIFPGEHNHYQFDFNEMQRIFPTIIEMMKKSPQDEKYHFEGDVWTHTKMVMEEMFASDGYLSSSEKNKEILFWSAFLHDVSKPITIDFDMDKNAISNANHSVKGACDARLFMWRSGFPIDLREHVCRIIRYHQKPFHWIKKMSDFELRALSQNVNLNNLIIMARADGAGRRYKENNDTNLIKTKENLDLMQIAAEEDDCLIKPWEHNFSSLKARKSYFDDRGKNHEDRPYFDIEGCDVIFMSGLAASGKDHWVNHYGEGREVLSYDNERDKMKLKTGNDGRAVQEFKEKAKKMLGNKRIKVPFILNATHINEEMRGKNLSLLSSYGATIRIVHLENSYCELLRRNEGRKDCIPPKVILKMARRWSPPSPLEAHQVIWWDQKNGKPIYIDHLTGKKDESVTPWECLNK